MGRGRSRRRKQRKRRSKQDAICLPPPQQPPLAQSIDRSADSDMSMPSAEMALVASESARHDNASKPINRQARRKARRERAKEKKRLGNLVLAEATPATASDDYLITKDQHSLGDPGGAQSPQPEQASADGDGFDASVGAAVESLSHSVASQLEAADAGARSASVAAKLSTAASRGRALTDPRETMLAKLRRWAASLLAIRRGTPARKESQPDVEQLLVIRSELAIIQKRLDKMIGSSRS